jgi:NTE family protein
MMAKPRLSKRGGTGDSPIRVGLVLGAGGVMGGAWITGGLHALATETGWDPASADYIVGTSAGAMMGSLLAAGVPPWFMVAHSAGESFEDLTDRNGRPASGADRSAGARITWHRGLPRVAFGSPELILYGLRNIRSTPPLGMLIGWGPRGMISTEPLKDVVRRVVPSGWADHPNLWMVAADYGTLERVVFGRQGSPVADLADAVAAACAIPSFYHPVRIGDRLYIDGGINSVSNLDLLADTNLDLVICLNPMSSMHRPENLAGRVTGFVRTGAGRRLGREARLLRERGTKVVLVQPTARDLVAMGPNYMSTARRHHVIETAVETTTEQLRDPAVKKLLEGLPPGEPFRVARPAQPATAWGNLFGGVAGERSA